MNRNTVLDVDTDPNVAPIRAPRCQASNPSLPPPVWFGTPLRAAIWANPDGLPSQILDLSGDKREPKGQRHPKRSVEWIAPESTRQQARLLIADSILTGRRDPGPDQIPGLLKVVEIR